MKQEIESAKELFDRFVLTLEQEDQELLKLRFRYGKTKEQTAQALGVDPARVELTEQQIRNKFRAYRKSHAPQEV